MRAPPAKCELRAGSNSIQLQPQNLQSQSLRATV
jgi:hypothetical protein